MATPTVFVVDDDEGSRSSIECLFNVHGIACSTFESAEKFLEGRTEQPIGCIVTDLNMTGMTGLELYQKTRELGWTIPTIVVTAFGEVSSCACAFKSGVLDYLEKPVPTEALITRVKECLAASLKGLEVEIAKQAAKVKLKKLTNKENEVLELLVAGNSMKNIAAEFGTSFQAVSRHRQRILEKIGVEGDVSLARWVLDHRRTLVSQ
jgi:FixJ family two-component response regulator